MPAVKQKSLWTAVKAPWRGLRCHFSESAVAYQVAAMAAIGQLICCRPSRQACSFFRVVKPVEVAEPAVHASETFLTLRQPQPVEVGDDLADERQPDGDDHCDHEGR
jgi:hypothetical protein